MKSLIKDIKVDITLNTSSEEITPFVSYGVQFTDWVKQRVKEMPILKPLTLLSKQLLSNFNLNIPYHGTITCQYPIGGMSSYVLIMMLSAFLKSGPCLPTLGHYFLEALRYYGYEFKTDQLMVAQGELIMFKSEIIPSNDLLVLDKFLPDTNAAANITEFERIRQLFCSTHTKLISGITLKEALSIN